MNSLLPNHISLDLLLRAAALAQLAVAFLNLFLIRVMKWKPDLDRAPLLIREVFRIHVVFISITLSIFAALTWGWCFDTNLAPSKTSEIARGRLLSIRGEALFYATWDPAIFIHYETDPQELQSCVPYDLDFYRGRAFVSLVAFSMRGMRPRFGGRIGELLLRPFATHHFLNVRTYIRHNG